jgi:hypothetical protein
MLKMTIDIKNWFNRCLNELYTAKELIDFESNRSDFGKKPSFSKVCKEFEIIWSNEKNYVADFSQKLLIIKENESPTYLKSVLEHIELVSQSYKFGKAVVQTRNLCQEKKTIKCSFNVVAATKDDSNIHLTLYVKNQPKSLVITLKLENENDFSVDQFKPACFTLFFKSLGEMYLRRNFGLGDVFI